MQDINLQENKKSYYLNQDEWEIIIEEEVIKDAIADASLEHRFINQAEAEAISVELVKILARM